MSDELGKIKEAIQGFDREKSKKEVIDSLKYLYQSALKNNNTEMTQSISVILGDEDLLEKMTTAQISHEINNLLINIYGKGRTSPTPISENSNYIKKNAKQIKNLRLMGKTITISPQEATTISMIPFEEMRKTLFDAAGFEYTSIQDLMKMYKESGVSNPYQIPNDLNELFLKNGLELSSEGEIIIRKLPTANSYISTDLEQFKENFHRFYPDTPSNQHRAR